MTTIETRPEISPLYLTIQRARAHRGFMIGACVVLTLVLIAIFAPMITPHDPYSQRLAARLIPPVWDERGSWEYILGTDHLGRDYLSRLLYGARISLIIGFGAATVGMIIGVTLGICAAYFGGNIDATISWLLSCQLALPNLILAMALVFLIGPSLWVVVMVIGFLHWNYFLVVSRAVTLQIRRLDYVMAAQAIGSSRRQILFYEILPNIANQIIVIFTMEVGIAILAEASLSFLGVGVPAPNPSWGLMISDAKDGIFFRPWLAVFPGAAMFILVVAINLMGDGLRDITSTENRR